MENLKKIVSNQYFPAAAVLTAVVLFWSVGMLGGLSLLHNNQPPLTTLTWMLFVYMAAVLTPIAGILAAADLVRRWRRNRAEAAWDAEGAPGAATPGAATPAAAQPQPVQQAPAQQAGTEHASAQAAPAEPAQQSPAPKKPAAKKQAAKKAA